MRSVVLACPKCDNPFLPRMEVLRDISPKWKTCASCGARVDITALKESRQIVSTRGLGGPPAFPIGINRLGTFSGTSATGAFTIASNMTVGNANTLVVCMAIDEANGSIDANSLKWNAAILTQRSTVGIGVASASVYIFALSNATGATGNLVATATAITIPSWSCTVMELTNVAVSSADRTASGTGTSTSPATAVMSQVTTQDTELGVAAIGWAATTPSGQWTNGFYDGQSAAGVTYTVQEGLLPIISKGKYQAGKANAANVDWGAALLSIKAK